MGGNVLRGSLIGFVMVTVSLAGCLSETDPAASGLDIEPTTGSAPTFSLQLDGCEEGGFVALYQLSRSNPASVGEGYIRADVSEEMGNPTTKSMGMADDGLTGNWHQGFRCQTAATEANEATDFMFGYVGVWAEAPAWDVGGADAHVVLAGLGFEPGAIRDQLLGSTMADITESISSVTTWYAEPAADMQGAAYTEYNDLQKGHYYSYGEVHKVNHIEERTIRFWWAVPVDGSRAAIGGHGHDEDDEFREYYASPGEHADEYHPTYFDLTTTGGGHYAADGTDAISCHAGTDDHGPQGFLCQPTTTQVYRHGSISFSLGSVIEDVVVEEVWMH